MLVGSDFAQGISDTLIQSAIQPSLAPQIALTDSPQFGHSN
jgi:hypothetical protein